MKKSHPFRRVVLAGAATVSGIVLLLSLKPASDPAGAAQAAPQQPAGVPSAQGGAGAAAGPQTLTGEVTQTEYGPVQVRVTVDGSGRITRAEAVQAPSGGRSTQVSDTAVPRLNRSTMSAGSADIDTVSGATYTSEGYKKSLQSALDRAGGAQEGAQAPAAPDGGGESQTLQGEAVQTEYGPVQVRVTVDGSGRITRAEAVQAPSGGRSTQVSDTAVPRLNQNAVTAGSADIDAVSGATYTSEGYRKSLQSALDGAGG
ncbi:FMN-binding protein [Streptomyces sp. CRN 30]|uniref:FMN-binding protein n=1 Tax=Streptomyces sp. CRN 30 TaxID=3075613 RepID=UPI002A7F5526|nr:FMN-binding protein [Streptomyces sp. CRN 30]